MKGAEGVFALMYTACVWVCVGVCGGCSEGSLVSDLWRPAGMLAAFEEPAVCAQQISGPEWRECGFTRPHPALFYWGILSLLPLLLWGGNEEGTYILMRWGGLKAGAQRDIRLQWKHTNQAEGARDEGCTMKLWNVDNMQGFKFQQTYKDRTALKYEHSANE